MNSHFKNMSMLQPQEALKKILNYENVFYNHQKLLERLYPPQCVRYYAKSRDKKKGDKGTVVVN